MLNKRLNWIWIAAIIIIPFLFFGRHLFFGGFIGDMGDDLVQNLPNKILLFNYISQGQLPLWNPYLMMGFPLLADIQVGAFYLPNIISFLFFDHFLQSYNFLIIFHLIIAQVGMYLFLREEGLKRPSAFIGAFAFAFSAAVMRKIPFINMAEILALVPLFLFILLKFTKQFKIIWIFLGSLVFCFMIFAGHPASIGYFLLISGSFVFSHLIFHRKFKILLGFLLMIILGVILSSVQLLPFLNLLQQSGRSALELKHFYEGSMGFSDIISALTSWKPDNIDYSLYGGLLPIISLPLILLLIKAKSTFKHFILWAFILVFISVFLMLGENNPLYQYINQIPLYGNIRSPGRYGVILNFAMVISFVFIINWLLNKGKKWINIAVIVLSLLLVVDLGFYTIRSLPYISDKTVNDVLFTQNVDTLKKNIKEDNISFGEARVLTSSSIAANTNFIYGFEYIHGYNPLVLKDYKDMFTYGYLFFEKTSYIFDNIKLFSLYNLKYYVFPKNGGSEKQNFIQNSGFKKFEASPDFILYKNTNYTQRIYSPERIFYVRSLEEAKNTILSDSFNIKKDATLQSKDTDIAPLYLTPLKISEIDYGAQNISMNTESEKNGFLVVNDTFYPGWKALIDNKETEIYKTNGFTRGIFVPAGKHQVNFIYRPQDFYTGLYISVSTFAFLSILSVLPLINIPHLLRRRKLHSKTTK